MIGFDWKEHFDAIYCLSLVDNIERRKYCTEELKRVGILDSGIFHWKITVKNLFYRYIWTNPMLPAERWWLGNENALNCTLGHYEIMKECMVLGYKRVLILEDDCRFHKDVNVIAETLNDIPEYDILMLDKFIPVSKDSYFAALRDNKINDKYFDFSSVKLWSCACYALSEKGMSELTSKQERCWTPADHSINCVDNYGNRICYDGLKRVASIKNLAIQEFEGKVYRNETDRELDKNIYTGIVDRKDYNVIK